MGISENAAYLKGLADGLELDESTKEGKVILKLLDLVSEMAEKIDVLEQATDELYSYAEELDEDLGLVEDEVFSVDEDGYDDLNDDEEFAYDGDEEFYEVECPSCGEKICFTDDIDIEELVCPACGELVADAEAIGDDPCAGCDGNCNECDDK